jgi:mono/diheme cytochrome c family protein
VRGAARCSILAILALLSACDGGEAREWQPSDHQQPARGAESAQQQAQQPEAGSIEQAVAALYMARCGPCHGADGRGTPEAASLNVPDLSSAALQQSRTDEELAQVIRDGRGMMPEFGSDLNERGIEVLVAHVRTLAAE